MDRRIESAVYETSVNTSYASWRTRCAGEMSAVLLALCLAACPSDESESGGGSDDDARSDRADASPAPDDGDDASSEADAGSETGTSNTETGADASTANDDASADSGAPTDASAVIDSAASDATSPNVDGVASKLELARPDVLVQGPFQAACNIANTYTQVWPLAKNGAQAALCTAAAKYPVLPVPVGSQIPVALFDGTYLFTAGDRPNEGSSLIRDVFVEKRAADGTLAWSGKYSVGTGTVAVDAVHGLGDDVVVVGLPQGQLPGQPVTSAGNSFLLKFKGGSAPVWVRQEADRSSSSRIGGANAYAVRLDQSGNSYVLYADLTVQKVDADGNRVWQTASLRPKLMTLSSASFGYPFQSFGFYVDPAGSNLYVAGRSEGTYYVARLDQTGGLAWLRVITLEHRSVIDPVEGIEWSGNPFIALTSGQSTTPANERLLVRGREFYVVGTYANVFKNGAIPPPPYYGVFVTKFDDRGELLWGHQYRAAPLEPYAGTSASADCLASYSAELADNGDVLVAASKGTSCMDTRPRSIVLRIQPDGTPRTD